MTTKPTEPALETDKLIEALGLDPEQFEFNFQFIYRQQKFHFYLLINNLETNQKTAVYLGAH